MKTLGYYNGKIAELEEMTVPMLDRAAYFGDGVYDVAISRNKRIFALEEHLDRFMNSCKLLRITPSHTKEELASLFSSLLGKMDSGDQMIYFQYSRGSALRSHTFDPDMKPNLWVMIKPMTLKKNPKPLFCMTMEDTRFFHCNIKTINLIPNVLAAQEAEERGLDECIFHRGEEVTECAHSNVSILKDGVLVTHPTDNLILPGIARAHLIRACKALGIGVEERPFTLDELMDADEILVTSTTKLICPVVEIDKKPVAGKDQTRLSALCTYLWDEFERETN
ncbi:MAG: aminotransferase class IV [Clostridia bacterium]|nr:aminotransferase class IV [Clostridia bacterium]